MTNPKTKGPCPFCETGLIYERPDVDKFQYGADPYGVILSADVIVTYCDSCGEQWTDWRSEEARHQAVEEYLKTQGIYLCTICHEIPVAVHLGLDTCDRCASHV